MFRCNADRAKSQNRLFLAVLSGQPGFCIHDITDYLAIDLDYKIKLWQKILMPAHDMD